MSQALTLDTAVTMLDRLTCAHPSPDGLRERARFWREYAASSPHVVSPSQAARIATNCRELDALADRMGAPAVVLPFPKPVPAPNPEPWQPPPAASVKPVQRAGRATAPRVSPKTFWAACAQAVAAVTRVRGSAWMSDAVEETASLKLSKPFAEARGHFVMPRNRWDFTVPAALYWPGGAFPAGIEPKANVRTVWRGMSEAELIRAQSEQRRFDSDATPEGALARAERQLDHARACLAHATEHGSSRYGALFTVEHHRDRVRSREIVIGQIRDQIGDRNAFDPAYPRMRKGNLS